MTDDRQPGGSEKVEYTRGGVPKQCPGCRHRFHPAGQCQHEWREYGVENPTEQRCLCDRNMAIRIPEPGGSGAGSTVDGIHVIARKEAWEEWAYDHDALGRSRLQSAFYAGWVACTDDLHAALDAAEPPARAEEGQG